LLVNKADRKKNKNKSARPEAERRALGDEIRDDEKYFTVHTTDAAVRFISSRA